jgi:cobalamin-dependent methionine synthase I
VRHEHFGSAILGDFLRTVRLPLDERAHGPLIALTTLSGEAHGLGLQMAAVVLSLAGWRVLLLGTETPSDQVVALAREAPLTAVGLSLVQTDDRDRGETLTALRRRLPRSVTLVLGGAAAGSAQIPGTMVCGTLGELDRWARGESFV